MIISDLLNLETSQLKQGPLIKKKIQIFYQDSLLLITTPRVAVSSIKDLELVLDFYDHKWNNNTETYYKKLKEFEKNYGTDALSKYKLKAKLNRHETSVFDSSKQPIEIDSLQPGDQIKCIMTPELTTGIKWKILQIYKCKDTKNTFE